MRVEEADQLPARETGGSEDGDANVSEVGHDG
jgi:hypothetical protein